MNADEFRERTKAYPLRVIRLTEALPGNRTSHVLGRQLLRAGASVGANYRAACRAKSRPDFIAKMNTVEEECDETLYWIELLVGSGNVRSGRVTDLQAEGEEILRMVVASVNTARRSRQSAIRNPQSAME